MADVPLEELLVLRLVDEPGRRAHLVIDAIEPALAHPADERVVVLVATVGLLVEELEVALLTELLEAIEDAERREAGAPAVLRGVEQEHAHLTRRRARHALVRGDRLELLVHRAHPGVQHLRLVAREPRRDHALRVELGLLERRQLRGDAPELRQLVAVRLRASQARQHRPERRGVRRMRGDVPTDLRHELRVVDLLLERVIDEIRRAHERQAPAKRVELGVLAERAQVQLVRARDHHHVERQRRLRQRRLAGLDGEEQILPSVERALQQIAVLEDAARRLDELALHVEERERRERRGQRAQRAIGRDLALRRVDGHLRTDGDGARAIAARDGEALDLHVREHLAQVAAIGDQQRVQDLLIAVP